MYTCKDKSIVSVILLTFIVSSCVTARWAVKDGKHNVIECQTGVFGENMYDSCFEKKAKEICEGDYRVISKSFTPVQIPESRDSSYFYWTVECDVDRTKS